MTNLELARTRQFLGLTVAQMSKMLGTPARTYYRWETGKTKVPGVVDTYISTLLTYALVREDAVTNAKEYAT